MVDARLTPTVREIVYKFYSSNRNVFASADYNLRLAASLYAIKVMGYQEFRNLIVHEAYNPEGGLVQKVLYIIRNYIVDLRNFLSQKEIDILLHNYTSVINDCLDFYGQSIKTDSCLRSQPYELTLFCSKLIKMEKGAKVYNPFAGLGSFAIENPNCIFSGEEINDLAWAFMQIRLDVNDNESIYKRGDSFDELETVCNSFDYVISNPPYGIRREKYTEFDTIRLAMENKLKDGGTLQIVLPMSFCYAVKYKPIREYLIDNGYLSTVISLPNIFAPITNVKTCVVVAKKKKQEGFVLIEGSKFFKEEIFDNGVFEYEALLDAMGSYDSSICSILLKKEDLDKNLDLTPFRQVYSLPEMENPTKLGHIINLFDEFKTCRLAWKINFKDVDWANPLLKIEKRDGFISNRCFEFKSECLITRFFKGELKTGIIKDNVCKGDMISISHLDFAYQNKRKDLILDSYLRIALESDLLSAQITDLSNGLGNNILSVDDFLELTIPVPSIEIQKRIVDEKLQKILQQAGVTNTYADLAHMLGTPFSKISSALAVIEGNPNLSTIDKNAVKSIYANLGYVTRLLDMNMGVSSMGENQEPICLYDFVIGYLDNWKLYGAQTFNVEVLCDDLAKKLIVKGNKEALTIMFDCLLDNANRHGFHKKRNPQNKVVINIQVAHLSTDSLVPDEEGGAKKQLSLLLKVGNNGTPMPDNFGKSDYITKGRFDASSGRTGLGGYHVYSVVKSMDGDIVDIIKTSGWTEFLFIIPVCINN